MVRAAAVLLILAVSGGVLTAQSAAAAPVVPVIGGGGNWVGQVGSDGWVLAGWNNGADLAVLPAGVTLVATASNAPYTWAAPTTDPRALESWDSSSRRSAVWWHPDAVQLTMHFTAAYAGTLSVYAVDWDSNDRREIVSIDDGTAEHTAAVTSTFHGGVWVAAPVSVGAGGSVTITATRSGAYNAVVAGVFLGGAGAPRSGASAGVPVQAVTGPQGDWQGHYGSGGRVLAAWSGGPDSVTLPAGVSYSVTAGSPYAWVASTTNRRALASPSGGSRSVGVWYGSTVQIALAFAGGYQGTVSVYAVDWDSDDRRQTVSVSDGEVGHIAAITDSFAAGAWVTVPVAVDPGGSLTINVVQTGAYNAVVSGVFLDAGALPDLHAAPRAQPQGSWVGTFGDGGHVLAAWDGASDATALPVGVTASLEAGSRYLWEASTADGRALQSPAADGRRVGVWYGDEIRVKLHFPAGYRGAISTYAVDWDSTERREDVTIADATTTVHGSLNASFNGGAWVTGAVDVAPGGDVVITVTRTGAYNAVLSGIFLGNFRSVAPSPVIADPMSCGLAGGNLYFSSSTFVPSIGSSVVGCWHYEGCLSDLPSVLGTVQVLACEHLDVLSSLLSGLGAPFRFIMSQGPAGPFRVAWAGSPSTSVLTRPVAAGGVQTAVLVAAGTVVVSGAAYLLSEAIDVDTSVNAILQRDTQVVERVKQRVQVATDVAEADRDRYRAGIALDCLKVKAVTASITAGLQSLGLGTPDADGFIGSKHLCELLPIYMPGDFTKSGSPMPHSTQHIREALGWSPAPSPFPQGEVVNPAWSLLQRIDPVNPRSWLASRQVANTLAGTLPYPLQSCQVPGDALTCDEFPYASTAQGGVGGGVSLKLNPEVENSNQGADLGNSGFYRLCGVAPGAAFIVMPLPRTTVASATVANRSTWVCAP